MSDGLIMCMFDGLVFVGVGLCCFDVVVCYVNMN